MRIESVPCGSCNEATPANVAVLAMAQSKLESEGKAAVHLIHNATPVRPPPADATGRLVDVTA